MCVTASETIYYWYNINLSSNKRTYVDIVFITHWIHIQYVIDINLNRAFALFCDLKTGSSHVIIRAFGRIIAVEYKVLHCLRQYPILKYNQLIKCCFLIVRKW